MAEHYCGVGGVPREGHSRIRRCRCGEWYIYGHGRTGLGLMMWRPLSPFGKWLHRREIIRTVHGLLGSP